LRRGCIVAPGSTTNQDRGADAMRKVQQWGSVGLALLVMSSPAHAGWNEFWARFKTDYNRNAVYPQPFTAADKDLVRQHIELTEANGWKLQNTLGDMLFAQDSHELNEAGQRKIRWIMAYAPPHRRQVFVLQADNEAHTAQRMQSAQQFTAQLARDGNVVPVFVTDRDAPGIPGQYMESVEQQYWKTIPTPRLPSSGGGSSSSSSSGGGAGGSSS
jgi:hypothetical protein